MAKAKVLSSSQHSLADKILAARHAAETFVESKVDELKASEEGRQLPRDWLRLNTYAVNWADRGICHCRCALQIMEKRTAMDDNDEKIPALLSGASWARSSIGRRSNVRQQSRSRKRTSSIWPITNCIEVDDGTVSTWTAQNGRPRPRRS
jgi:hypothetical protein